MKNLPEDELFNFVENRLRDYSELPDEDGWNKIAGAVTSPSEFSKWTIWTNRTAATLSLVILFLLFNNNIFDGEQAMTSSSNLKREKEKSETAAQSSGAAVTKLIKPEPGLGDNSANVTLPPNPMNPSMENKSVEQIVENIDSMQAAVIGFQKDENLLAASPSNNKIEENIDETLKTENAIIEDKESKPDPAASVEHVIPPQKKRKKSRLTFYSMISPSLSFQHVTPDTEDGVVVDKVNSPGVMSQERFGFTIESGVQGRISERFQYIAGLSYYQQSQQISYDENSDVTVIESGGDLDYDIKPTTITQTFNYNMRNIGVQAGVLYTLKLRGLMHKAGVVLQYQKGLMQGNESDVYDNSSSDYFNYQLLYRLEYAFRSGVGLFVQPAYSRSIIANESLETPFKLKQSRASLGVGIVYRF